MNRIEDVMVRYRLWRMSRRAAPNRAFKRALLARLMGEPARFGLFSNLVLQRLAVPVSVLVLSLGVSGYAYASSGVTTGHPLYRFKRKFEGYEEQLRRTPEQQAMFFARKSERRLAEAVTLAHDDRQASEAFFVDAVEEMERGLRTLNQIPDPLRRRRAVNVILKKDGSYVLRVQELAMEKPAFMKTIAPSVARVNRDAFRAQVQAVQDTELRELLRAHLLAREAMFTSLANF